MNIHSIQNNAHTEYLKYIQSNIFNSMPLVLDTASFKNKIKARSTDKKAIFFISLVLAILNHSNALNFLSWQITSNSSLFTALIALIAFSCFAYYLSYYFSYYFSYYYHLNNRWRKLV